MPLLSQNLQKKQIFMPKADRSAKSYLWGGCDPPDGVRKRGFETLRSSASFFRPCPVLPTSCPSGTGGVVTCRFCSVDCRTSTIFVISAAFGMIFCLPSFRLASYRCKNTCQKLSVWGCFHTTGCHPWLFMFDPPAGGSVSSR